MAKGTKLFQFEKVRLQCWKESENLREKFQRPLDAVKSLSAITWKAQIIWNKKIDWQSNKIITTIQEKNCLRSKKENFINIKNIKISSGCLQY